MASNCSRFSLSSDEESHSRHGSAKSRANSTSQHQQPSNMWKSPTNRQTMLSRMKSLTWYSYMKTNQSMSSKDTTPTPTLAASPKMLDVQTQSGYDDEKASLKTVTATLSTPQTDVIQGKTPNRRLRPVGRVPWPDYTLIHGLQPSTSLSHDEVSECCSRTLHINPKTKLPVLKSLSTMEKAHILNMTDTNNLTACDIPGFQEQTLAHSVRLDDSHHESCLELPVSRHIQLEKPPGYDAKSPGRCASSPSSTHSSSSAIGPFGWDIIIGHEEETSKNSFHESKAALSPSPGVSEGVAGGLNVINRSSFENDLREASLWLSTRLTYGQVLYAKALASGGDEVGELEIKNVVVIDGLDNDDWSYYAAATYPKVTFYSLSPRRRQPETRFSNHRHVQYFPYIPNVPSTGLREYPLASGSVTSVVYRFPPAAPERHHRHVLTEARRVMKPGGYLEMLVIGSNCDTSRWSCEGKRPMAWTSNDNLMRLALDIGFCEIKIEPLRVSATKQLLPQVDSAATLKRGITDAEVYHFWYTQCYKNALGCCEGTSQPSISLKVLVCRTPNR